MSIDLVIQDLPNDLLVRLKESAELNQRSLESEALVCLQHALIQTRVPTNERLARAGELRQGIPFLPAAEIDAILAVH